MHFSVDGNVHVMHYQPHRTRTTRFTKGTEEMGKLTTYMREGIAKAVLVHRFGVPPQLPAVPARELNALFKLPVSEPA